MTVPTDESAIRKAVRLAGSQSALARKLGLSPQAVQKWCSTGEVPDRKVLGVEAAVSGAVSRHELRPDLYPEPVSRRAISKRISARLVPEVANG